MTGADPRSRVFRQVVTIEVLWLVPEGVEPPHTDMGAVVRDALTGVDLEGGCYVVPGEEHVSAAEELCPTP